jgi:hypothetical protein
LRPFLFSTYPELVSLSSADVCVSNHYHGELINYSGQTNIIYTSFSESLSSSIVPFLSKFTDKHIIVVTAQKLDHVLKQKFNCDIITVPSAYAFYSKVLIKQPLNLDDTIEKYFTSFNNRAQWTRLALVQCVEKFNLYDKFFLSYHNEDRFLIGAKPLNDMTSDIIGNEWYNDNVDKDELFLKFPIRVDEFLGNDCLQGRATFYSQALASVVTETYIDENFDPFLTEKTFKPLAFGHPFLLSSSAGALTLLHDLGFKTFGDIFDETYDTIESPQLRMSHILQEVVRMCSLDKTELRKIRDHIRPIIQHNYDFFWNEFHAKYLIDIENVKNQIRELI